MHRASIIIRCTKRLVFGTISLIAPFPDKKHLRFERRDQLLRQVSR